MPLIWAEVDGAGEGASVEERRPRVKTTTTLHVEQEREAVALASSATEDRSGALTADAIKRGVQLVTERDSVDFGNEHGLEQRRIIKALGTSGRFAVAVGVGGAGKTTFTAPVGWKLGSSRGVRSTERRWLSGSLIRWPMPA